MMNTPLQMNSSKPISSLAVTVTSPDSTICSSIASTSARQWASKIMSDTKEWTDKNEIAFLQIIYERVKNHPNRAPSFNDADWSRIDAELQGLVGVSYGVEKLKGKYSRCRVKHRQFKELIDHTGVTWEVDSNKVHAPEEVWQKFFLKNKLFKAFKRTGCKNYELLSQIFSPSTATGAFHFSSSQMPPTSDEERLMEEAYFMENTCVAEDEDDVSSTPKKKSKTTSGDGRRRHCSSSQAKQLRFEDCMETFAASLRARTEISNEKLEMLAEKKKKEQLKVQMQEQYTIEEVMEVLNNMESLSATGYTIAVQHIDKFEWRKVFLHMPMRRRLEYLQVLENKDHP